MQSESSPKYLAHSANDGGRGDPEPLQEHLNRVVALAQRFAEAFSCGEQARVTALLHDAGKYGDAFQRYIRGQTRRGGNHAAPGAVIAARLYGKAGLFPAVAIDGHHGGMAYLPPSAKDYCNDVLASFRKTPAKFTTTNLAEVKARLDQDGLSLPPALGGLARSGKPVADMLDARMLFSALVDADHTATEGHFAGDAQTPYRPRPEAPPLDLAQALQAFQAHLESVRSRPGNADSPMRELRETLLDDCIAAAAMPTGLFTLSAPTGSGKTLAMLAFALHHARHHGLRRIVVVLPFLNIIDQTVREYREVFSETRGFDPGVIQEHHSLAEYGRGGAGQESDRDADRRQDDAEEPESTSRSLAPNWDAPIIVTTTVQFFESLFSARPSRCRKLHRLAKSVILFDEVQTLPPNLAVATLAALSRLAQPDGPYGSSVLFATATQPAFETLRDRVAQYTHRGWEPREIVRDPKRLFSAAAGRVRTVWRHETPIPLEDLARELRGHERVMCIVNLRRHAADLARLLQDQEKDGREGSVLHLSTNMCPEHRLNVLRKVNERLAKGVPIRLVATQCVEAGVDLDFPVVYRAVAPLEALVQAAGRCNRHGGGDPGRVVIFRVADERSEYPPGYKYPVDVTQTLLKQLDITQDAQDGGILYDPGTMSIYFASLYKTIGRDESRNYPRDERELWQAIDAGRFDDVERHYRLIPDVTINVLTPYNPEEADKLTAELENPPDRKGAWIRDWIRRASRYAVSMFRPPRGSPLVNHLQPIAFFPGKSAEVEESTWFSALPGLPYDDLLGLVVPDDASSWLG
ncbi:MAG: CRISPR-associated helicase Cas3' [Thermogutta sp.]|nr:CRISPR-associated helicase Cas3' [Thermogutta sp.]